MQSYLICTNAPYFITPEDKLRILLNRSNYLITYFLLEELWRKLAANHLQDVGSGLGARADDYSTCD